MTPYYADDWLTVYLGDCREVMATLEPESVHCVVTSPPYWGLRDYGVGGQLGLEPTPEAYVESMVAVFREVRRVLRSDGTVWLNLGDSYASDMKGSGGPSAKQTSNTGSRYDPIRLQHGLKPKDLVGIPWRVAFALQADGWYLRSDIIWSKPNPMPESVTDRPTKAHEYLFLLSKSPRYYFDAESVKEPANGANEHDLTGGGKRWPGIGPKHGMTDRHKSDYEPMVVNPVRNIRSVWTIATQPYPGAHFATFPRKLVEPCIKAGTSERGVCPECGAPWERVTTVTRGERDDSTRNPENRETTGWAPTCGHGDAWVVEHNPDYHTPPSKPLTVPATVLDPFAGSGTTALVAQSLSRRAVLIDLSGDYLEQVMERNRAMPLGLGA